MKKALLYIICCLTVGVLHAQEPILSERFLQPLSPVEVRYDNMMSDVDVYLARQFYANPAFYGMLRTDSLCRFSSYRMAVCVKTAQGNASGDFLPYDGKAWQDVRLAGTGNYSLSAGGTFFGTVQYARGQHKGIGWSATRSPQYYLPYLATDSIGGHYRYEDYRIQGGYAFCLAGWCIGVKASFSGEQAWRKTDPRALNNTTWLRASIGAAHYWRKHTLMLQSGVGRNKQHLSLRYWRPGQQDRFFIAYGLGLYDTRKSGVFFGYSRMYYVEEGSTNVVYRVIPHPDVTLYAGLDFRYERMKAEETDIQDLYGARTFYYAPSFRVDWRAGAQWTCSFFAEGNMCFRKGYENIFEEYLVDEPNNIYDFRLIDTRQKYRLGISRGLVHLRFRRRVNTVHAFAFGVGTSVFLRDEMYTGENYRIKNESLLPRIRLDYYFHMPCWEGQLGVVYGYQIGLRNTYSVVMRNQTIAHLDFQHAFAPYAYYNSRFSTLGAGASCIRRIGAYGLGLSVQYMLTAGNRNRDAAYTKSVGFASSAPMISPLPDRHDEQWGSVSLFLVF